MKKHLVLVAAVAAGLVACGSDGGGVAATAKRGDAFCKAAERASTDNDALDAVDIGDPTKVKATMTDALDSLDEAVSKAPKDIADTADEVLTMEERVERLLKQNDYDFQKVAASDEGQKALNDINDSSAFDDFRSYLKDKCGIVSATDDTSVDTTSPSDDTTADTTSPSDDTTADTTSDTSGSGDTIVDLGDGADAINKFLDYYELGVGTKLSADERQCIVDALVDKVTGDELNQAISGNSSDKVNQALGLAFLNCNISMS